MRSPRERRAAAGWHDIPVSARRPFMARMHHWLGLSLLSFMTVGCVSMEQYKAATMDRDQYAERLAASERAKDEVTAARDAYKAQLDAVMLNGGSKDALVVNQSNQISELQRQLDELNRKYEEVV